MHMLLRHILLFLTSKSRSQTGLTDTTEISMRVLPVDLDFLLHVNNGVYFSFMDFGRMDMTFRNGIFKLNQKMGWYGVVAGETIKFKKSLKLWDKFTLQTKVMGHDDKYFFIAQKFLKENEIYATGMVKIRFLSKKGGTVPVADILTHLKDLPEMERSDIGKEWFELETKYLT